MVSNNKKLHSLLRSLIMINRQLMVAKSEKMLSQKICNILYKNRRYKLVWLGLNDNDGDHNGEFTPLAISGSDKDFVKLIRNCWSKYKLDLCPYGIALKSGNYFLIKDLKNEKIFIPWDKELIKKGLISTIILPIKMKNQLIGSLHIYSDKNNFTKDESEFLNEVALDIGMGILNLRNEKKIIEEKIEYEELIKRISSCVAIYEVKNNGEDYIFKDFNKTAEKIEKIKKDDLIGKNILDVFPAIKDFGLLDVFKRVYKTGKPEKHPISLYKDDRVTGWKENFVYKLPNGNIVAVYNDLTERKQYEENLYNFAKLSQESPNPIIRVDCMGKVLYCNQKCGKKNRKQKRACFYLPDKLRKAVMDIKNKKSNYIKNVEIKIGKNYFSYNIVPIKNQNYINLYGTNITKIKKLREDILKSERKYRTLFESAPIGLATLNKRGIIISVNKEMSNLCRLNKKEFIGKHLTKLKILNPDSTSELLNIFYDTLDGKSAKTVYLNLCDAKGNNKTVEIKMILVKLDKKDEVIQVRMQDITENVLSEQNLKNSIQKVKKTLDDTIKTLSTILEFKDPYTAGHQSRVAKLAVAISKKLKLGDRANELIYKAAMIHDIGKICIPQSLLSKPTALTDIEESLIKTHSKSGYDIIKNIDFGYPIEEIILQHHEREDGSGYPNGLKSENIMLEAKIIAVADVFEAMCTHRPYRPAYEIKDAINEIKLNKNKLYNPKVVNACIKLIKEDNFHF